MPLAARTQRATQAGHGPPRQQAPQGVVCRSRPANAGLRHGLFRHHGGKVPSGRLLSRHEGGEWGGHPPPRRLNENANRTSPK